MTAGYTGRAAQRPVNTSSRKEPLLQWASDLPTSKRGINYTGWLIDSRGDEAVDLAAEEAGWQQVVIKRGDGTTTTHYGNPIASVVLIAENVQLLHETRGTQDRYGISLGWDLRNEDSDPNNRSSWQSFLRVLVYERTLFENGYVFPLMLTVKGTKTSDAIKAFMTLYDIIDAAEGLKKSPDTQFPLYAFSLPLTAGEEVMRGSVQQKEVIPFIADVPNPITAAFFKQNYIAPGSTLCLAVEAMLPEALAWSVEDSKRRAKGEEKKEEGEVVHHEG